VNNIPQEQNQTDASQIPIFSKDNNLQMSEPIDSIDTILP